MDKIRRKNAQKVIIAMSGGVDSSVAAALLERAGFNVVGVFMKFWAPTGATQINTDMKTDLHGYNRCCSPEAENRARKVAKILKIPFYVFNFEKEFKKRIVDYFLKEYKAGRTPNPCVVCNKEIKFGLLLEKALKLNADYIATGHYAKKQKIENRKQKIEYKLLSAKDKEKDQSYFLWQLNQKQLSHILFPIGDYTRKEVENLARKFKLPVLKAKKSVEICFIQTTINDFLARHLKQKPGQIVEKISKKENKHSNIGPSRRLGGWRAGCSLKNVGMLNKFRVLGKHEGLAFYTIGQRKGIGLPGGPYYVLDKDLKKNLLIVTKNEKDLYKKELIAKNVNWISGKVPKLPLKIKAKIRYRHQPTLVALTYELKNLKTYKLTFQKPQRAITPGQSVVLYKGEELLGGGIIC